MSDDSFGAYLKEEFGLTVGKVIKGCIIAWCILAFLVGTANVLWYEGYEVTLQGTVQIAKQEENRFWRYKYTHIEIQSYSGEDYDLSILGHHDFTSGMTYKITYERVSPMGWHLKLYGKIISVETINAKGDHEDALDVPEREDVVTQFYTFDGNTSFYTHYTFSNRGNIPATEVKIILTYPAGTEIQKISPPYMKYTESEDSLVKIVELEIQRLDIYTQLSILVKSSHEPIAPPEIQCKERNIGDTGG